MSQSTAASNFDPFAEGVPAGYVKRELPPDSGDFERSVLGYLMLCLPEDALLVGAALHPSDFQWDRHRALYKRVIQSARRGRVIPQEVGDNTMPWLEADIQAVKPRVYLGHCMDVAAETSAQLFFCIDAIKDASARRQRFTAARRAAIIACDEHKTIEQIDAETNKLFTAARTSHVTEKPQNPAQTLLISNAASTSSTCLSGVSTGLTAPPNSTARDNTTRVSNGHVQHTARPK